MAIRAMLVRALHAFNRSKAVDTRRRSSGNTALIFVHGLSGSITSTWRDMLQVVAADPDLKFLSFDCYAYPSAIFRVPFGKRSSGVRELTRGLRTFIETNYPEETQIVLIGHSLGGVIACQFAIEELKAGRGARISGVALYACPRAGVALADVGSRLSWRHRHLRQLGRNSDLLEGMNEDWLSLKVEEKIPTIYVVGGSDAVVPPASGCLRIGADNVRLVPEYGHKSIVEPIDGDDLRFKILKRFLIKDCGVVPFSVTDSDPSITSELSDVLFDVYSRAVEPFYVHREIDRLLTVVTTGAHAWVSGPSGVGKTASLRRLTELGGWRLYHIMLGSYQGLGPIELMREICGELHERMGVPFERIEKPRTVVLLPYFRKILRLASQHGPLAILVEEIPIAMESGLSEFIAAMSHLTAATDTEGMASRVVWLFSSIKHPDLNQTVEHLRFRERVQMLKVSTWTAEDLSRLVKLIQSRVHAPIADNLIGRVVDSARGSPRFVKILYRKIRNENTQGMTVDDLLSAVKRDLFGDA